MSESASSAETPPLGGADSSGLASRAAAAPFQLSQEPVTPHGAAPSPVPGYIPTPAFEHLGELPATYGTRSLYLVAYDPRQLFAYWDLDWSAEKATRFALEVLAADGAVETRIELAAPEASRYIAVNQPGAQYTVQLTSRGRDGQWRPLAKSGPVSMPPEGIAAESEPAFATLPFHLSFQRLIDLLKGAMRPREDLTDVLARLQTGEHTETASLLGALGSLGDDQLRTLEMMAREGFDLREAGGFASVEPTADGGLSSPGPSSFGRFGGGGSENLSSSALGSEVRLAAAAAGAEALTSGAFGSKGRWLAGELNSEALSSRGRRLGPLFSSGGMGSESLTSRGFGSESFAPSAARGSEAWRRAGGPAVGSSENLSSSQSSTFLRAIGSDLNVLGSLFSAVDSQLSGERGGSSSSR